MGSSQDVSPFAADVHEFEAVVTNTAKPIVFIGYTPRGVELVYEMAAEVAGGLDNLRERPFLLLYPEPISPLVFPADVVDRMFLAADLGLPQIPGTAVQPGATGPVTLAGSVVQGIAEGLISLVLVQLRRPGAPCTLSVNIGIFDMATTQLVQAAPETSLGLAAQAEVAQSLGLPTWGLAGATDAKLLDAQAGIEATFSILAQGMAGLNLIHDVGYMDRGMICSPEMLVMGDEIIGMAKRFIRGLEVTADTLARSVIEQVGPGGHFLQEDHTYDHFRRELWLPTVMARQSYDDWQQSGSKDMARRLRDKTIGLAKNHPAPALPDQTLSVLSKLKQRGDVELTEAMNK
jgi:trimethylamine--corrinoid protein Co-methyltransferase